MREHAESKVSLTVRLHGAHWSNNFGDTLLAHLFGKFLSDRFGSIIYAPYANCELRRIHPDWRTQPGGSENLTVFHGGGYFGGSPTINSLRWSGRFVRRHYSASLPFRFPRIPMGIFGIGAGPFSGTVSEMMVRNLISRSSRITVRDTESLDSLRATGFRGRIGVYPDLALALPHLMEVTASSSSSRLGIHLDPSSVAPHTVERFMKSVGDCAIAYGFEVVSFTDHEGGQVREKFAAELSRGVGALVPARAYIYSDLVEMLEFLNTIDVVITDKLHVGICCLALGKSVIAVPRHPKTLRLYRQLGLEAVISTSDQLCNRLADLIDISARATELRATQIQQASLDALGHLQELEEFLEEVGVGDS